MHRIKLIIILLMMALICFLLPVSLWAGVSIAPAFVELSLDEKRPSGQFIVSNVGEKSERYRIMATHFELGINGELKKVTPDANSLVPWIKFNPKEFTLPGKSSRAVRFVVAPSGNLPDKAYWAFMELEPLTENIVKSEEKNGSSFNVKVSTSILVPLFATKGKVSYGASIKDTKLVPEQSETGVEATVTNEGTGHLFTKISYAILSPSGDVLKEGLVAKGFIFPGFLRKFRTNIDNTEIPKGNHRIKIICEAKQLKEAIIEETQHTW